MRRVRGSRQRGLLLLPVVIALTLIAVVAVMLNRDAGMNLSLAARGLQADSARYVAEAGLAQINYLVQSANCSGYPAPSNVAFGNDRFSGTATPTSGTPVTLNVSATTASGAKATLTRSNVVAHQTTPYVMTLQPGPGGTDTYIESNNVAKNFGASKEMRLEGGQRRGLIRFNLSTIPAAAIIQSAQMMLYKESGASGPGGSTIAAYRMTQAWTEGAQDGGTLPIGANWNTSNGLAAWTAPGGDYDASVASTVASTGSNNVWVSWDVTNFVTDWVGGTTANNGMILIPSGSVPGQKYISGDDNAHAAQWPRLVVTFLPPCGWTPVTGATLPASADAQLDENNPTSNHGASTTVQVDNSGGNRERALYKFDLSSVPSGTRLTSATMRIYVTNILNLATSTLTVHRVTEDWVEGSLTGSGTADGATWNKRDATNNWSTPGGSFIAGASASDTIGLLFLLGWVQFDVTALAQAWLDGVSPNYGVLVRINTGANVTLNARESAWSQPELVLNW